MRFSNVAKIDKFNKDAQYPAPKRSAPVQLHWTFAK
jgi:hypothetical protein